MNALTVHTSCWVAVLLVVGVQAAELRFQHRYIDRDLPGASWGQTALVDVDKDGGLDFITGQSRGPSFWYRQESPHRWVRHKLGENSPSDVDGKALDVDGDRWVDFVTGGAWYRNNGKPRSEPFERIVFDADLSKVHDLVVADMDGDGRPDILTMSDKNNLRWYQIPKDPRQPWKRHDIGPSVHAGIGVGDMDGDGDLDVVRSNMWFENADGKGTKWVIHENVPFGNPNKPYPLATHCEVLDLDRDGDNDLVMTENEIKGGRIGWLENLDGKGGAWKLHELPKGDPAMRGAYHSLIVADFDNDGDADIFTCEMEGIPGDKPPRWFLWENADGTGGRFVEHVILDAKLGGHLAVAADVDGDGDLDIVSKLWRPRKDNANQGRNHVDFLENQLIRKSRPPVAAHSEITVDGARFLLNGQPFPYTGVSFFNAIYNPTFNKSSADRTKWLEKFRRYGINVLRVWCQWDSKRGFVDAATDCTLYLPDGRLRAAPLATLKAILADADRLGMVIELCLFSHESFRENVRLDRDKSIAAVTALTHALQPYRNLTFQVWNEHHDDNVLPLVRTIKALDPRRLVTSSPGFSGELGPDDLNEALDYLTPHTSRQNKGNPWELAPRAIASLLEKFHKPVVDDEPARCGTSKFGGPKGPTSPDDHIRQITAVRRVGGYITYHHDMFQTGYGSPAVPPSGIPDPEFSPYHRTVFEFLARHDCLILKPNALKPQ